MPSSLKLGYAAQLRVLSAAVRQYPVPVEIADAFDVIADAMEPCLDCGHDDEPPESSTLHLVESTLTNVTEIAPSITEIH